MEDTIKIIVFQMGIQFWGMEIKTLAGVLSTGKAINISNAKYPSSGEIICVNHDIIPVLDLHEKLQIPPLIPIENMLIVFSSKNEMLAIPIDRVETIYSVPYQNLYSVPTTVQNGIIKNIAVLKDRLIPLFAPEQLFMLFNETEASKYFSSWR